MSQIPLQFSPHDRSRSKRPRPEDRPISLPAEPHERWSRAEEYMMIGGIEQRKKWKDISKTLPGRTIHSCRMHYKNHLIHNIGWYKKKQTELATVYKRLKSDLWNPIAKELGIPWQECEAMQMARQAADAEPREPGQVVDEIARVYERFKLHLWNPIAKELGLPWHVCEAMHWAMGENSQQQPFPEAPDETLNHQRPSPSKQPIYIPYSCFRCEKPPAFGTCSSWRKHMKEHETVFPCRQCEHSDTTRKPRSYKRKAHLVKHLCDTHDMSGSDASARADTWRKTVGKKYFSCGFCVSLFFNIADQLSHIDTEHFQRHQDISGWNISKVIQGLIQQPGVSLEWQHCIGAGYPRSHDFAWKVSAANDLQLRLELGEESANVLATAAISQVIWTKSPQHSDEASVTGGFTNPHVEMDQNMLSVQDRATGVDPTSATQDILRRVQAAKNAPVRSFPLQRADQPLANALGVAGESTSLPGLYCQTQDYPGDTALAPPYQASQNDIPTIPQATRRIGDLKRGIEEQWEPGQAQCPRPLCPTQAQHTLSGGPRGQINEHFQSPESGIRNDDRKKRQRCDSTIPIGLSSQKTRETKSAKFIPRIPFTSFLEQFKGDLWRIVYVHKHNHTLIQFARAMDEVFQVLHEDHKVKIEVTYAQWETRKRQWDEDWAIGNGGPSAETVEGLQGLPTWLECHDGAVRPKARRSISVTGGMVHQDPLVYSQWNDQQLAWLADIYERRAPDFWKAIAREVGKPSNVCEAKFLAIAHKCTKCHRIFGRPADLKRNVDSHAQGGFMCPAREGCQVFTRRDHLRSHLERVHSWVLPKTLKNAGSEDAEQVYEGGQILFEQSPNLHPAAAALSEQSFSVYEVDDSKGEEEEDNEGEEKEDEKRGPKLRLSGIAEFIAGGNGSRREGRETKWPVRKKRFTKGGRYSSSRTSTFIQQPQL